MTNEYGVYQVKVDFPRYTSSKSFPLITGAREVQPVQIMIEADKLDYWQQWFDVVAGTVIPNATWKSYQRKVILTIELSNVFPQEIHDFSPASNARRLTLMTDDIKVIDVKIEGYE